jgi:acyl-CoA hydrolase
MNGAYWSSSGGQADFAQGAMLSDGGKAFIVVPSTAKAGTISRIVPTLPQGSVVTTTKNTVDHIVTEFGVARLRGRTVNERARMLIELAHPDHRDFLAEEAGRLGYTR